MMERPFAVLAAATLFAASCSGTPDTSEPNRPAVPGPTSTAPTTESPTVGNTTKTDEDQPSDEPPSPDSIVCWAAPAAPGEASIAFSDATVAAALVEPLTGMHGHAAAWGDVNGDGHADLLVGTFANRPIERYQVRGADGPRPDSLLLGTSSGSFEALPGFPEVLGRTSGVAITDLDGDGDQDIVLSRNMRDRTRGDAPSQIYRNDGESFALVDIDLGRLFSGRSVGALDYNRDGLIDLILLEDRFAGERSSVLLHNEGDLSFTDRTLAAGLPGDVVGLGIATSDLNGDGRTDFFVAGANRLFVATDEGFGEATTPLFQWETFGNEDDVAGAAIGDLNRDGRPDLVVGHHYNSTLSQGREVPIRVYLNVGNTADGMPQFEDVTDLAGLLPLPTKAPHVEIADFDNDGWPDILTSASAADGTRPAIFRHEGVDADGVPRFAAPPGLGAAQYWVAGPTADVDRDGRLDVLLVEWEPTLPSLLLRNETASGHWLQVSIGIAQPIGTVVSVWPAGSLGEPSELIGVREIVVSQGYTSGNLPIAHFGLGDHDSVDIRAVLPDGTTHTATHVQADQHVRLPGGC